MSRRAAPPVQRFMRLVKVNPGTGCWEWQGYRTPNGYGKLTEGMAHRTAWKLFRPAQPLAEGFDLHHLCRVRHCVNPDHLQLLTSSEHRGLRRTAEATHCKHGHEWTPENTYWFPGPKRVRACRQCQKAANLRHQRRRQEQRLQPLRIW